MLEPTAVCVMKWAMKLYRDGIVLQFMNQLDLSTGENFFAKCNGACNWYEEVILNRKFLINHLIEQRLAAAESEYQLVFPAAGKSPLALELLERNNMHNSRYYFTQYCEYAEQVRNRKRRKT